MQLCSAVARLVSFWCITAAAMLCGSKASSSQDQDLLECRPGFEATLDDHYKATSRYHLKVVIDGKIVIFDNPALGYFDHGVPYGESFDNWESRDFPDLIKTRIGSVVAFTFYLSDTDPLDWVAVRRIYLKCNVGTYNHLVQDRPRNCYGPHRTPVGIVNASQQRTWNITLFQTQLMTETIQECKAPFRIWMNWPAVWSILDAVGSYQLSLIMSMVGVLTLFTSTMIFRRRFGRHKQGPPVEIVPSVQTQSIISKPQENQRPAAMRDKIFISYSHKDRRCLEELKTMLSPLVRSGSIQIWDDSKITTGGRWKEEIEIALGKTKVAVLLVSPDFLASDFIAKNELPPLLKSAQCGELTIFWIHVSASMYHESEIEAYQAAHDVSRPLDKLRRPERRIVLTGCGKSRALEKNGHETGLMLEIRLRQINGLRTCRTP